MVRSKILIQKLWKGKYDWDDLIPLEFVSQWNALHTDLLELKDISWSRFSGIGMDDEVELRVER